MQNKRITGEDFDQKLFRSLARIGSSMRGVGMPKIPSAGRRGVGGRVKPSRATRADWPSDAEIADMVDRNGDGFVGDGEPWMTRARNIARGRVRSRRGRTPMNTDEAIRTVSTFNPMAGGSKKRKVPKKKPTSQGSTGNLVIADPERFQKNKSFVAGILKPLRNPQAEQDLTDEDLFLRVGETLINARRAGDPAVADMPDLPEDLETARTILGIVGQQWNLLEQVKASEKEVSKFRPDPSNNAVVLQTNAIAAAMTDSEIFERFVKKFGLPRTGIATVIPDEFRKQPDGSMRPMDEALVTVGGAYAGAYNVMFLSGKMIQGYWDLLGKTRFDIKENPDSPGGDIIGDNVAGLVRHEYGHYMEIIKYITGSEESRKAIDKLYSWFESNIESLKAPLREYTDLMGEGRFVEAERLAQSGKLKTLPEWVSSYGTTEGKEFLAELFTMATSNDPKVRNAIPASLRPLVEQWLDMKIF